MMGGVLAVRLVYDVLLTVVFLFALLSVYAGRRRLLALLLGVPTLAGLWSGYVLPELPRAPLVFFFHVVAALFLSFTVVVALADVYGREEVDADSISAALCGYLLVGLGF